ALAGRTPSAPAISEADICSKRASATAACRREGSVAIALRKAFRPGPSLSDDRLWTMDDGRWTMDSVDVGPFTSFEGKLWALDPSVLGFANSGSRASFGLSRASRRFANLISHKRIGTR